MKSLGIALMALCCGYFGYAQFSISGTVKSESAEVLPGATVMLQNLQKGTITDVDGNFKIGDIPSGEYTLQVSFLGYNDQTKDIEVSEDVRVDFSLKEDIFQGEEVFVYATRANEKTPTTYSEVSEEEIESRNLGQDMPYILRFTPSMVTTSDAGAGVGYTGMRIRGSDATRINVTVNGIPINDSESHGTFWVNMPDFASSVNNIQVQRGVGTSTNGAAAFGATINMQTSLPSENSCAEINNSYGSFDTRKHTVIYNTGLINDRWSFEGRLSQIASDGYIDRASSDLKSYYLSGGYYGDKTTVKALSFGGKEVTYQSWYGTPEAKLENDPEGIQDVIDWGGEYTTQSQIDNLMNSGRTFNYYLYENEVDNYQQDHYQLHGNHTFSSNFNINAALHYTYGRGYYEQYRNADEFSTYGLEEIIYLHDSVYSTGINDDGAFINDEFATGLNNNPEIYFNPVVMGGDTVKNTNEDVLLDAVAKRSRTDLIRRRWLDNHFYGATFSANYQAGKWRTTLGGAYNFYDGDHFGEVIWARFASGSEIRERYYDNFGRKEDFNIYSKTNYQVSSNLNLFVDLQYRRIDYNTKGIDSDQRTIDEGGLYNFFNPKFGVTYVLNDNSNVYASYAIGNREPVRTDFIDAPQGETPKHETLKNLEVGYRRTTGNYTFSANYYLMSYDNQLVVTGELNDVGSSLRANVDESYRTGIELVGGVKLFDQLRWEANLTLSANKIDQFTEVIYDYGENFDEYNVIRNEFEDSDIAFSPNVIAGNSITYSPITGLSLQLLSKYVGQQYLDNTNNEDRVIDAYFTNDVKLDYAFSLQSVDNIQLSLMINNVFDVKYSANGYTWGYRSGDFRYQQNNYYPQAGINFLAGLSLKF